MFSHEKLTVYQKALTCVTVLNRIARTWDGRHAMVDHIFRASESILLNLAEGARLQGAAKRQHWAEYAIGSALECAACLDIGVLKGLLAPSEAISRKESLCEVVRMLTGLRRSWGNDQFQEEAFPYQASQKLFAHERLEVYQVGLQVVGWLQGQAAGAALSSRLFRQVDKLATSVVLNIAEGNGRYCKRDRHKFVEIARTSAAKTAAYVDLCWRSGELEESQRVRGLELLRRVAQMLRALAGS